MKLLSRYFKSVVIGILVMCATAVGAHIDDSTCYGTTSDGSLENAVKLPKKGENFVVFHEFVWALGRTYVHSKVALAMDSSFKQLAEEFPEKKYMYAETGLHEGGLIPPHKTHQNGLSVDFFVPVVEGDGKSVLLPIGYENEFGYAIEFNEQGNYDKFQIDFESMAHHLKVLDEHARSQGFSIKRVIFDPRLQPMLLKTKDGSYLQKHISFNNKQAWVRHDEHYHVDFDLACESKG